jgi:hypothetical protein
MNIITCNDWTDTDDYQTAWAPTNDPRVLAVIQRDSEASFSTNLDGDAILPVFLVDRDSVDHVGGFDGDSASIASRIVEARDRFRYAAGYRYNGLSAHHIDKGDAVLARWAWIFHGTTFHRGDYGYGHAYDVLILNTPEFRAHIEDDGLIDQDEAQKWVDSMSDEVRAIAEGEVYGIGWATLPERVLADDEIDFDDFEVDIQCWGYVGETYAKRSAGAFESGAPELPEMLSV